MKDIAMTLNGTNGMAHDPEELTELFKRSVEVIEYREQ